MKLTRLSRLHGLAVSAVLLTGVAGSTIAQDYPSKPIRVIVPFPPGGPTDILARTVGQKLAERLGQPVVVDNRGGASGNIGTELVARAAPDGYTFLLVASNHAMNPSIFNNLPFDPVKDFAPVTNIAAGPFVLVVHPSVPARSVRELIDLAKARPGQVTYASASTGSANHLGAELFRSMAGIDIVHVPYRGAAPATTDLLAGQVSFMFNNMPSAIPHIRAGKLRALAVTSARRSPALPDVPTVAEGGLAGFEVSGWYGILAPAGTPKEIVAELNREIVGVLRMPDVKERLASLGVEPVGDTPEQFAAYIRVEIEKWAKVVEVSGARAD